MDKLSLQNVPVKDKKVLIRVDFNIPLDSRNEIIDDSRIQESLPTIKYVLNHGGSAILMSHLGRPKGKKNDALSLKPAYNRLCELLPGVNIQMESDCVGSEIEKDAHNLKPGSILLLENLRFHPGEENPKEHPEFVKALARLGDVYVNDAFASAHRAHASTAAITQYFPTCSAAGFALEKEIRFMGDLLEKPKQPFYAIIGGAKISTKIGSLKTLIKKTDRVLIGGAMAFTFFKAQGIPIGRSPFESEEVEGARALLQEHGSALLLPIDMAAVELIQEGAKIKIVNMQQEGIPEGWFGIDIGPKTIELFAQTLKGAKTIFWNGPMGIYEIDSFATGTLAMAKIVSELPATTIVGGGDSLAAVKHAGVAERITHLSTGGGASLEYIEFGSLPGIEALSKDELR